MKTTVKVSVVMCTYNGKQFLRQQMDSILAQSYPLHEIIVQDDQSTDDTWDILESYRQAHPGLVKIHRNVERLGFNRNFHTALMRATGDVIAISDQDDIWFANKISRQVDIIGNADVCFQTITPMTPIVCPYRLMFRHAPTLSTYCSTIVPQGTPCCSRPLL